MLKSPIITLLSLLGLLGLLALLPLLVGTTLALPAVLDWSPLLLEGGTCLGVGSLFGLVGVVVLALGASTHLRPQCSDLGDHLGVLGAGELLLVRWQNLGHEPEEPIDGSLGRGGPVGVNVLLVLALAHDLAILGLVGCLDFLVLDLVGFPCGIVCALGRLTQFGPVLADEAHDLLGSQLLVLGDGVSVDITTEPEVACQGLFRWGGF